MTWSEVVAPPKPRVLRQFAALWLICFVGLAAWRTWHGQAGLRTELTAVAGLAVGGVGLVAPGAVRYIYLAAMIGAFPIGWTMSRVALALAYYGALTPVALAFRLIGRDSLAIRKRNVRSYWLVKARASTAEEYFRQS